MGVLHNTLLAMAMAIVMNVSYGSAAPTNGLRSNDNGLDTRHESTRSVAVADDAASAASITVSESFYCFSLALLHSIGGSTVAAMPS